MSDRPDQDAKTQDPTEKKLADALDKGNTPSSREAPIVGSIVGILLVGVLVSDQAAARFTVVMARFLENPGNWTLSANEDGAALLHAVSAEMFAVLAPVLAALLSMGLAASILHSPPRFALERIRPKASKLSVVQGARRLLGKHGFAEFIKALVKLCIVAGISLTVLRAEYGDVVSSIYAEPSAIPVQTRVLAVRLLFGVAVVGLVLAAVDVIWSRHSWRLQLKMTHQEVKDEHKQADGDPLVKSRLRSLAKDRSRRRMMAAVPTATFVIVNPTHYAIALRFVRGQDDAPLVVAKGKELIALKIREIAEDHEIPVIDNKPLARSMFDSVEVNQAIPEEFYEVVAKLIHYLETKAHSQRRIRPLGQTRFNSTPYP